MAILRLPCDATSTLNLGLLGPRLLGFTERGINIKPLCATVHNEAIYVVGDSQNASSSFGRHPPLVTQYARPPVYIALNIPTNLDAYRWVTLCDHGCAILASFNFPTLCNRFTANLLPLPLALMIQPFSQARHGF